MGSFQIFVFQKKEVSVLASTHLKRKWLEQDEVSSFVEHLVCTTFDFIYLFEHSAFINSLTSL
jgi:hypothetical protein